MRCKDCKSFKPHKTLHQGECALVFEEYQHYEGNPIILTPIDKIIFGDGGHYDSITVGENFGCIHFEDKRFSELQEEVKELERRLIYHMNDNKLNSHND